MHTLDLHSEANALILKDIAFKIRASRKIVFIAGAGISCNAGIPDFRSKDGLYSLVKKEHPNKFVKGQDLFDINLFRKQETTEVFYSFMAGLRTATLEANPTPTHAFLKTLKDKKKLLRCYTQNIDGLEYRAGLTHTDVIQLHGDLHTLRCMNCQTTFDWSEKTSELMADGEGPNCTNCVDSSLARALSGKRSTAIGKVRPDIILYGEDHPGGDLIANSVMKDVNKIPQILIVMGTSLKVLGIKRLVKDFASVIKHNGGTTVLVNKSHISKSEWGKVFDYHILADSDEWVSNLKKNIPNMFEVQTKLDVERKRRPTSPTKQPSKAENEACRDPQKAGIPKLNPFPAKRTKSDPYEEIMRQNMLLRSPKLECLSPKPELNELTDTDELDLSSLSESSQSEYLNH